MKNIKASPDAPKLSDEEIQKSQKNAVRCLTAKGQYFIAVIANIFLLYVFNNLLRWDIPFITQEFSLVLPVANLSLRATIIGNCLLIVFDPLWLRAIVRLVLNLFGLYFMYTLVRVFPFDLSSLPSSSIVTAVLRLSMLASIFGMAIATVIEFTHMAFGDISKINCSK